MRRERVLRATRRALRRALRRYSKPPRARQRLTRFPRCFRAARHSPYAAIFFFRCVSDTPPANARARYGAKSYITY